jgi:hypothetical protein
MADLAELLIAQGNARAAATAQQGRIWGNLVAGLGQLPQQMADQGTARALTSLKLAESAATLGKLQREEREATDTAADKQAIGDALQDADGDLTQASALITRRRPSAIPAFRTITDKWRNDELERQAKTFDVQGKRADAVARIVGGITDDDPASLTRAQASLTNIGGPDFVRSLGDLTDPAVRTQHIESAMSAKEAAEYHRGLATDLRTKRTDAAAMRQRANGLVADATDQASWDAGRRAFANFYGDGADAILKDIPAQFSPAAKEHAFEQAVGPEKYAELKGQAEQRAETKRKNLADEALKRQELQGQAEPLTPQGLDLAANQFAMTGTLPPLGQGKAGSKLRADVIYRAAALYQGLDLASQKAAFAANQRSLAQLQPQVDALNAFEQTAGKNLDQFVTSAGKVIDTGSPWINAPLRGVAKNLLGSTDQQAFDVARTVVVPELAKVLTNPGLSGQLTDTARREVERAVADGATLAQIQTAAKVLRTDMKNRHTAYTDQITAIQRRIATPPGQTPTAPAAGGGKTIEYDMKGNRITP